VGDHSQARALAVRAEILWALTRAFRGESLLSVPSGWEWLIEAAWNTIITNVPSGYEVVVRLGYRRLAEPVLPLPRVRHAA